MACFFMAAPKSFQWGEEVLPKGTLKDGGMAHEEFEEYLWQLLEEKMEWDKAFAQKKAGQATVWLHLWDKSNLVQGPALPHMANSTVELPQELPATVQSKEKEHGSTGAFAFLTKLQDVDPTVLRNRVLGSVDKVKEKCTLM